MEGRHCRAATGWDGLARRYRDSYAEFAAALFGTGDVASVEYREVVTGQRGDGIVRAGAALHSMGVLEEVAALAALSEADRAILPEEAWDFEGEAWGLLDYYAVVERAVTSWCSGDDDQLWAPDSWHWLEDLYVIRHMVERCWVHPRLADCVRRYIHERGDRDGQGVRTVTWFGAAEVGVANQYSMSTPDQWTVATAEKRLYDALQHPSRLAATRMAPPSHQRAEALVTEMMRRAAGTRMTAYLLCCLEAVVITADFLSANLGLDESPLGRTLRWDVEEGTCVAREGGSSARLRAPGAALGSPWSAAGLGNPLGMTDSDAGSAAAASARPEPQTHGSLAVGSVLAHADGPLVVSAATHSQCTASAVPTDVLVPLPEMTALVRAVEGTEVPVNVQSSMFGGRGRSPFSFDLPPAVAPDLPQPGNKSAKRNKGRKRRRQRNTAKRHGQAELQAQAAALALPGQGAGGVVARARAHQFVRTGVVTSWDQARAASVYEQLLVQRQMCAVLREQRGAVAARLYVALLASRQLRSNWEVQCREMNSQVASLQLQLTDKLVSVEAREASWDATRRQQALTLSLCDRPRDQAPPELGEVVRVDGRVGTVVPMGRNHWPRGAQQDVLDFPVLVGGMPRAGELGPTATNCHVEFADGDTAVVSHLRARRTHSLDGADDIDEGDQLENLPEYQYPEYQSALVVRAEDVCYDVPPVPQVRSNIEDHLRSERAHLWDGEGNLSEAQVHTLVASLSWPDEQPGQLYCVMATSLQRFSAHPFCRSAARLWPGKEKNWFTWSKRPADGTQRDVLDPALHQDILVIISVPPGVWLVQKLWRSFCLRTTAHECVEFVAAQERAGRAYSARQLVVLLGYDAAVQTLQDHLSFAGPGVTLNGLDFSCLPAMTVMEDIATYLVRQCADVLRGTCMVQIFLSACHPSGFDTRGWIMCGLCFASLPFWLRAHLVPVIVALARTMQLGDNTPQGRARGRAHAHCFEHIINLKPFLDDGLVDGKWGIPEGVSCALSGPLTAPVQPGGPPRGYFAHMDNSNDSRRGFDVTGIISYTGDLLGDGVLRRISLIGYSRFACGKWMDNTLGGTRPKANHKAPKSRKRAPRSQQASGSRPGTSGVPAPLVPLNTTQAQGHRLFVRCLANLCLSWLSAEAPTPSLRALPQAQVAAVQQATDPSTRAWLAAAKTKWLAVSQGHRSQLTTVVSRVLGGFSVGTAKGLAAVLQAFQINWFCSSKSNGGERDSVNFTGRGDGLGLVFDVSPYITALSNGEFLDVFSKGMHEVVQWAVEMEEADRFAMPQGRHTRPTDVYACFGAILHLRKGKPADVRKGVVQAPARTAVEVGVAHTKQVMDVCSALLHAKEEEGGPVPISLVHAGRNGKFNIPQVGETSIFALLTLLAHVGVAEMETDFMVETFGKNSGGGVLYSQCTQRTWAPRAPNGRQLQGDFRRALFEARALVHEEQRVDLPLLLFENVACKMGCKHMLDHRGLVIAASNGVQLQEREAPPSDDEGDAAQEPSATPVPEEARNPNESAARGVAARREPPVRIGTHVEVKWHTAWFPGKVTRLACAAGDDDVLVYVDYGDGAAWKPALLGEFVRVADLLPLAGGGADAAAAGP